MGYYQNIKCGSCKYSFTNGFRLSNGILTTYMGIPYIRCPKCRTVNNTKLKPYSTFHFIEKVYHWFAFSVRMAILGFIWSIPCLGIIALMSSFLGMVVTDSLYEVKIQTVLWTMPIISLIYVCYKIKCEFKEIIKVEEEYKCIT